MTFGKEYSSDYAYFIAGGQALAAIKKYEADKENVKALYDQIVIELGAKYHAGMGASSCFVFKNEISSPALELAEVNDGEFAYVANEATPEGRALIERLEDIPDFDLGQSIFAKRLMGSKEVETNPDKLAQAFGHRNYHYDENARAIAATYKKYGDLYVIGVPRVIRGIFNEDSKQASLKDRYNHAAGYSYEWQTPPDSTPIPYSKVIELQELEKGDQLSPQTVTKRVATARKRTP